MTPLRDLPKSRAEIERIQSARKKLALAQARRAPFFKGKLDRVNAERLDDPDEWRKIPVLDKDTLRKLDDREFYRDFCLPYDDGIAEYWRSGGSTGTPLFYPRSFADIEAAMIGFARVYDCTRCRPGTRAHVSFPSAFTLSARCWRGRPGRAALLSTGPAPAPPRRRYSNSN
jgi:phenylacetate-CoA ligase